MSSSAEGINLVTTNTYSFAYVSSFAISLAMYFIASFTVVGIHSGTDVIGTTFTGDIHALSWLYQVIPVNREEVNFKLLMVFLAYTAEAILMSMLSIYALAQLFCDRKVIGHDSKQSNNYFRKHNCMYFALVSIGIMTNVAVLVWSKTEISQFQGDKLQSMLTTVQSRIRTSPDGDHLNLEGEVFHKVQKQFDCCGVNMPFEWIDSVDWFRYKYLNVTSGTPIFPCISDPTHEGWKNRNLHSAPCYKNSAKTVDCTLESPRSLHGCAEAINRHAVDYLCRLTRLSMFCIVLQTFQFVWLMCICRAYNIALVPKRSKLSENDMASCQNDKVVLVKTVELPDY